MNGQCNAAKGTSHCYHALIEPSMPRARAVCCWCGEYTETWGIASSIHGRHAPGIQTVTLHATTGQGDRA
jgi:hypothetical protein